MTKTHKRKQDALRKLCLMAVLMLIAVTSAQAQTVLTGDQLQNGQVVELDKLGWKYSPDDDPRFADPHFDDRAWETLQGTSLTPQRLPQSGWRGLGWFRLRLNVDAALANQALALVLAHHGASEIYLDGKLIQRYGTVGITPETEMETNPGGVPLEIVFATGREHLLAVRRSQARWQQGFNWRGSMSSLPSSEISAVSLTETGFRIQLARSSVAYAHRDNYVRRTNTGLSFIAAIFATLGFLHLMFFFFYPPQRANLWFGLYGLFVFFLLLLVRLSMISLPEIAPGISGVTNLATFGFFLSRCNAITLLAFLYTFLERKLPRYFYVLAVFVFSVGLIGWLFPYADFSRWIGLLELLLVPFSWLRVVWQALRRKEAGATLIGFGVVLFAINPLSSFLKVLGYASPIMAFQQIAALLVSILFSLYLARQLAQTSRNLETQLEQVLHLSKKELEHERERARMAEVEAEHDRKTKELEEARQLQLSMLPKKLPELPHLDIAAYMKTASEVGGDYYDFHLTEDGTLTIAVGDATGHGLKAGTLVASVKSLFVSLAYHPDIPHIFHRMSRVLKEMKLRGLFMAMTIAKVKEKQLILSIAGMPPVWIYRAAHQQIEEVSLQQLPLGGVTKYTYQQRECALNTGDVVVLMSDGLPERFNKENEMLEDESAKLFIAAHAHLSAQEIINGLVKLGDDWGGTRPQDDDVTFVVVKIKKVHTLIKS